jgi:hypothetical protein
MALAPDRIAAIVGDANRLFAEGAGLTAVLAALRAAHAGIGLTFHGATESALIETPFQEEERYLLFLVDRRNHCWTITGNPEHATGLVLAEREDD